MTVEPTRPDVVPSDDAMSPGNDTAGLPDGPDEPAGPEEAGQEPGGDDGDDGDDIWGKYGRRPIILLAAVGFVDRVDKGILPGVVNLIQDELGFTDFQFGLLETAYVIAGLLVAVPAGYLADRRRRTRIIGVVLAGWAALSALTAAVQNYLQMFSVRATLGVGETVDDPASQSLLSDYYPAEIRGRAYAYHRVTPTVGTAVGLVLGSVVGAMLGWRAAFLIVGVPGSLLALAIWRLPDPERGESDLGSDEVPTAASHPPPARSRGFDVREMLDDALTALKVPSFRALFMGTAINSAALQALGFWGVAYYQRTSGLEEGTAGALAGGLILLGALGGSLSGGFYADRVRGKVSGAAMLLAAGTTGLGAMLMFISFLEGIPVFSVRLPMQILAVGLVVAALPATTAMTSEVVRPTLRSTAFSLVRFGSTILGAVSPPIIGLLADQFDYTTADGEVVGDLGQAFLYVIPFLFVGAYLYWRGRRSVERDRAVALASIRETTVEAPVAADDADSGRTADAAAASGSAVDEGGEHAGLSRALGWTGAIVMVLGGVLILLGWRGAAGTAQLFEQMPYLVSGGVLGTALLALGGLALTGRWFLQRHERRQQARRDLHRSVEELRDTLRHGGPRRPGEPSNRTDTEN